MRWVMKMKKCASILAAAAILVGLCSCRASAPPPSGSMMPEKSKYVDYTGAILPLTTREAHDGLSVQRSLNLDFSQWTKEDGIAQVQDDYILTNTTDTPIDLMLYYPVASSLEEWREESCSIKINEVPTEYQLYYARPDSNTGGRFEIYDNQYDDPYSVGEKIMLYMDHAYNLERAFEPMADLSQITGYRYRIVDVQYDSVWPMPREASLCLSYNWDDGQGILRGYGFTRNSSDISIPGTDFRREMVLVDELEHAFLMSVNGTITDYTLGGYSSQLCEEGSALPKLTARLEVEEMPLSQLMEEAAAHCIEYEQSDAYKQLFTKEAFNRMADDLADPVGADGYNSLGYYLHHMPHQERIFWLEIPVSIGAGEAAEVSVRHRRAGGAEIHGPAAQEGIWHYDILPNYGTNLKFESQYISATGNEHVSTSLGRKLPTRP